MELSNTVSTFDVQKQNDIVKRWAPKVKRALKNSSRIFQNGKTTPFVMRKGRMEGKLSESITARIGKRLSVAELVSFSFERHGVFVHKGVGKGWKMNGSFAIKFTFAKGGKARKPVPWFNPVLDIHVPLLADEIATVNLNAAINATKLQIK